MSAVQVDRNCSPATPLPTLEKYAPQASANGQSIVSISPTYHRWFLKQWFERSLAATGLVLTGPLLLLLIVLIRLTSRGPALYWQERVGLCGRVFRMCKLRSMTMDAEEWTGAVWAQENDPRVTKIGRVLRKFHLDELVQLWNIARGEMSFIGPRPERPEIALELSEEIPGYEHRWTVLPGVTGLAQVNLSPDQTVNCVRKKIELDLEYIFTAEPFLDMRIMGCTILKMIGCPQKIAAKLLRVARSPEPVLPSFPVVAEGSFNSSVNDSRISTFGFHKPENLPYFAEETVDSPTLCSRN